MNKFVLTSTPVLKQNTNRLWVMTYPVPEDTVQSGNEYHLEIVYNPNMPFSPNQYSFYIMDRKEKIQMWTRAGYDERVAAIKSEYGRNEADEMLEGLDSNIQVMTKTESQILEALVTRWEAMLALNLFTPIPTR